MAVASTIVALASVDTGVGLNVALAAALAGAYTLVLWVAALIRDRTPSRESAIWVPATLMLLIPVTLTVLLRQPRYEALLLLPVLWGALYGSRGQLTVILVVVVAALGAVSELRPELGGLRSVLAWAPLAPLVGLTVHELVRAANGRAAMVRFVSDAASRALDDPAAAHEAILEAAVSISGCDTAFIMEPDDANEALELRAMTGTALPAMRIPLDPASPSMAVRVFRSGQAHLSLDVRRDPHVSQALVSLTGARSALVLPIQRRSEHLGVLAVLWSRKRLRALDSTRRDAIEALAVEAAAAFDRNHLLEAAMIAARTDDLTGLANRRHWRERAEAAFTVADAPLSVALFDIDHFKAVNDRDGHRAGDEVLQRLGARWATEQHPGDILARYGGEEFVALLHADDDLAPASRVEELRRPLGAVTLSAGLASRHRSESLDDVLRRADRALYAAKAAGRDRLEVAEDQRGVGTSSPDIPSERAAGLGQLIPAKPSE